MIQLFDRRILAKLLRQHGAVAVLNEIVSIRDERGQDNSILGPHVQSIANAVRTVGGQDVPLVNEDVSKIYKEAV